MCSVRSCFALSFSFYTHTLQCSVHMCRHDCILTSSVSGGMMMGHSGRGRSPGGGVFGDDMGWVLNRTFCTHTHITQTRRITTEFSIVTNQVYSSCISEPQKYLSKWKEEVYTQIRSLPPVLPPVQYLVVES